MSQSVVSLVLVLQVDTAEDPSPDAPVAGESVGGGAAVLLLLHRVVQAGGVPQPIDRDKKIS